MAEVIGRMEEREKNHEATLVAMEKEMTLKQQAMEALRKKVKSSCTACILIVSDI